MKNEHKLLSSSDIFLHSGPEEQLHQISLEDEQDTNSQMKFQGYGQSKGFNASLNGRLKIFNNKQAKALENPNEISQWIKTQNKDEPEINNAQKKKKEKMKSKPVPNIESSNALQNWISSRQSSNDEKFLSMAELCHRYTFVNQHGSHREYFNTEEEGVSKYKVHHPVNIELKLQSNQDYLNQKFKTNYKFIKGKEEVRLRLPALPKMEVEGQKEDNSNLSGFEHIKNVLELLKKSASKRKIRSESPKPKEKSIKKGKLRLNSNIVDKSQERPKINWKEGHRYEMQLQLDPSPAPSIRRPKRKQTSFSIRPELLEEMKEKSKSRMERVSKSLQQCLILSRK